MAKRPLINSPGQSVRFKMPNIFGRRFNPGIQIYSPGETATLGAQPVYDPIPWPNAVPVLSVLANHPGIPRTSAQGIFNNSTSALPENYLFIAGFSGKSRG